MTTTSARGFLGDAMVSSRRISAVVLAACSVVCSHASAAPHENRFALSVAPLTIGLFTAGTDGHNDAGGTALAVRAGYARTIVRGLQVGVDGTGIRPYGGQMTFAAVQAFARAYVPFEHDRIELGVSGRVGPMWAHADSGPAGAPPTPSYFGAQYGGAIDVLVWTDETFALGGAIEAIYGNGKTSQDLATLGYYSQHAGPIAIAFFVGAAVSF